MVSLTTTSCANLAILHARVLLPDAMIVRFRNTHASTSYTGGSLLCISLINRLNESVGETQYVGS